MILYYILTQIIDAFLYSKNIKLEIINNSSCFHSLCISNHVSELDPILLLYVFNKYSSLKYKFISDKHVKKIPIIGQLSNMIDTIYIDRNDTLYSITIIKEYVTKNTNICMFPEGTLFYKPTIKKSNKLCNKLNILPFNNVLCPKINGFNEIYNIIKPKQISVITFHYIYSTKSNYKHSDSNIPLTFVNLIKNPPTKIVIIINEKSNKNVMKLFRQMDKEMDIFIKSFNETNF